MRTHFYISSDSKEIKKIGEQIRHFPISDKFIRSGSPVLSFGEIRPTNIVPIIAPDRKGNADFLRGMGKAPRRHPVFDMPMKDFQ